MRGRSLWLTWGGLLAILATTAGVSYLSLGPWNAVVALGLAIAKATLIALVFMELRGSGPLERIAAGAGLFWLGVLLTLSLSDYLTRGWTPWSSP